ncbi:MAG: 7-cyano-7-deazaguanine synthase QueC [Verrucomicrobia bacterium]|nr:7-cyano-7-deazaguanine synthase QueC [Verrucomicrobiota bacterium]MCH8510677.1 7-cyano-7-deazaguanine synthase QueC [Kiritimatiellia bacterium]
MSETPVVNPPSPDRTPRASAPLAVVLVSGGLDSCVTAAMAAQTHRLAFLHLNYGQRTENRERQSFNELARAFAASPLLDVHVEHLAGIGGSSLTDANMPVTSADLDHEGIPSSYVPFRNANILAIAVSWAEVIGATAIFIGAVAEDSSGYPDCRPEFFEAFQQVIRTGTKPETEIRIHTPIIHLKKSEIIQKGIDLGAPLEKTWSCYQSEDRACGVCDSCALRLRGFQQLGVEDPIPYAQRPRYFHTHPHSPS